MDSDFKPLVRFVKEEVLLKCFLLQNPNTRGLRSSTVVSRRDSGNEGSLAMLHRNLPQISLFIDS